MRPHLRCFIQNIQHLIQTQLFFLFQRLDQMRGWRVNTGGRGAGSTNLLAKLIGANGLTREDLEHLVEDLPGATLDEAAVIAHARKGLAPLLQAFAQLGEPRARLLVAGRAARKELPPGVTPLGYVDDMPALYAAADWTVLPSRYEPFGLVIAESLACGTPAIIGREAGVAELMSDADGLLLDEISAPAILATLRQACAAPQRVAPGFITAHGLDLAAHIAALKACV